MKSLTKEQVLLLLDYTYKNIPRLMEDSKKMYNKVPHNYTMQKLIGELIADGQVDYVEVTRKTDKIKFYKLKDA